MRNRFRHLAPVFGYIGTLLMVFSALVLLPLLVMLFTAGKAGPEVSPVIYLVPAVISFLVGTALHLTFRHGNLTASQSMLVCALGWLAVSGVGALPFWLAEVPAAAARVRHAAGLSDGSQISLLDAYFEAAAGFTTTGITMLQGLEHFQGSLLFWRSLAQWFGGLGILSFFILVLFSGGAAHTLYGAESNKIFSKRPRPGIFNTVKVLWLIYIGFTVAIFAALLACRVSVFESLNLSLTCASTGGFAPYDESVGHLAAAGFPNYRLVEYVLMAGMLLGSVSFLAHYRFFSGRPATYFSTEEIRLWWLLLFAGVALVALDVVSHRGTSGGSLEEQVRSSAFQTVSFLTTTGYATRDISATGYFYGVSRQVFLVLMIMGGCAGSTSGGYKLHRVVILAKALAAEVSRAVQPRRAVRVLRVDGEMVDPEEVRRAAAILLAWLGLIVAGGIVTAAFSTHGAVESFSGMTSVVSNIGPCYISREGLVLLHPVVKIVYILGMVAGRLEILPVLLLFNRRAWS